jgi:hypothetical protein
MIQSQPPFPFPRIAKEVATIFQAKKQVMKSIAVALNMEWTSTPTLEAAAEEDNLGSRRSQMMMRDWAWRAGEV